MRRIYLSIMALACTIALSAQPTPSEVTNPGSKGTLPNVPTIASARDNEFTGLELANVGYDTWIFNGYYNIIANLSFPMVEELEGDYYTVQYRNSSSGDWKYIMDGDNPAHYSERTVGITPSLYTKTDYRLVMHGGPLDGYVSNVVTATPPNGIKSRYTGWSESPTIEHCMVDIPVGEEFTVSATTHKDDNDYEYSTEDGYFTYQWYRRNPNNWDMEKIEGATDRIYTPTIDDVGYQLVIEVGGDNEHASFTLRHPLNGVVCVPVQASIAYIGTDGFVLNTDYVIPEPRKMFTRGMAWGEDPVAFDTSCVSVRKPGQYVFRIPEEDYQYCVYEMADPAYFLTFVYEQMGWYREAQVMGDRYKGILGVKAKLDGNTVPTTIDVIGKNIDDEWVVVASQAIDANTDTLLFEYDWDAGTDNRLFYGDYYVKARATDSSIETFYPDANTMESATLVNIGEENSWEPKIIEIGILPTGVKSRYQSDATIESIWSVDGYQSASPGLRIIRMSDGTTRKMYME